MHLIIGNGVSTAVVMETASDQIYNSSTITVINAGTLNLNNYIDAFYGLSMTGGTVETGTGVLTLYGNVTTNASSDLSGDLRQPGSESRERRGADVYRRQRQRAEQRA